MNRLWIGVLFGFLLGTLGAFFTGGAWAPETYAFWDEEEGGNSGEPVFAEPKATAAPQAAPKAARRRAVPVQPTSPGVLAVTRVSDTAFVVVKDHGTSQTTMYFTVDAGIPVMKQRAKYMYAR